MDLNDLHIHYKELLTQLDNSCNFHKLTFLEDKDYSHFESQIDKFKISYSSTIDLKIEFAEKIDLIKSFNSHLALITKRVVRIYLNYYRYSKSNDIRKKHAIINSINFDLANDRETLKSISNFHFSIKHILSENKALAIELKDFFMLMLEQYIDYLSRWFGIDIYKSPLSNDFINLKNSLNESIDLKKIKLLNKLQPYKQVIETKQKPNKSLLFEGKDLNLLERYKIANKVLNVDNAIRKLNIQDLEKYQLLAYILGCDKDNARNLMNGTYNAKDRDLSQYFNDLGLKI